MPPITIIVLGNNHADFTIPPVLVRIFEQLAKRKIPCAFMAEGPSDETLTGVTESTTRGLQQTAVIKQLAPEIHQYYIKDKASSRLYLPKSAVEPIREIVRKKFMPYLREQQFDEGILANVVLDIFRENAYHEEIALFQKLEQRKIPFSGIDADTATFTKQMIALGSSERSYSDNELIRINTMVENVYRGLLERFPEGGIVFVSTGNNHARRLAANLLQYAKSHAFDLTRIDLHAFITHSSYVEEFIGDYEHSLKLTEDLDSPGIREIYASLPCRRLECQTDKGTFHIPELEALVTELSRRFEAIGAPAQSVFQPLSSHNQLVQDIKDYLKGNPVKVSDTFIPNIERHKDYSLALRNACAWGSAGLVKIIIKYSDALPIDFHQTSKNGNTPLMWFAASGATDEEKVEIKALLEEKMVAGKQDKPRATAS